MRTSPEAGRAREAKCRCRHAGSQSGAGSSWVASVRSAAMTSEAWPPVLRTGCAPSPLHWRSLYTVRRWRATRPERVRLTGCAQCGHKCITCSYNSRRGGRHPHGALSWLGSNSPSLTRRANRIADEAPCHLRRLPRHCALPEAPHRGLGLRCRTTKVSGCGFGAASLDPFVGSLVALRPRSQNI